MKIAEEKRKLQDEMKRKKEEMMAKFEKLLKKGKLLNREEFYKQIFNDNNYSPFASKDLGASGEYNLSENQEKEEGSRDRKEEKTEEYVLPTKKDESFSKNELNTSVNQKKNPTLQPETPKEPEPVKEDSVKYLSVEEIKDRVGEKKRELEHSLLDVITKFEIEEKKYLEEIKEEDTEEEKTQKNEVYLDEKNKNEQKVSQLKEYELFYLLNL